MHRKTRMKLTDINPLLTCSMCKGYLINATTLTECLHSFCRNCIVHHLTTSKQCPTCDVVVHKTRPLLNARPDRELQNIVYKLIPGLFKDEMKRRRDFYSIYPKPNVPSMSPAMLEDRGEVSDESLVIYSDDESMYLSLEYSHPHRKTAAVEGKRKTDAAEIDENGNKMVDKRYLRCPAAVCIKHIKKFIMNKFDLKPDFQVEITYDDNDDDPLPEDYTLMDVAYIYTWRRSSPMPLVFRVFEPKTRKKLKVVQTANVTNGEDETESLKKKNGPSVPDDAKKQNGDHPTDSGKTNGVQPEENGKQEPLTSPTVNSFIKEKEVDSGVEEESNTVDDSQEHERSSQNDIHSRTLTPSKRKNSPTLRNLERLSHPMAKRTALFAPGK